MMNKFFEVGMPILAFDLRNNMTKYLLKRIAILLAGTASRGATVSPAGTVNPAATSSREAIANPAAMGNPAALPLAGGYSQPGGGRPSGTYGLERSLTQ